MHCGFQDIFKGLKVLVTGHTGFKGSWLSIWLRELGADVVGYSLPPPTSPSNFELSNLSQKIVHVIGDIRDYQSLKETIHLHKPQLVFHLAAQPIVLHSYRNPKETFDVNAGGTVNVLEAARECDSIKAMVMITSDKCYENQEWLWGYREGDTLGGPDPYSASKAMAELVISSYRKSFFEKGKQTFVASARAGNVIGGGDFSDFRLVPDSMKALMKKEPIIVRNPNSVRPWLNVLEPLSGYLWIAAKLLQEGASFAEAWNVGPLETDGITAQQMVEKAIELWGSGDWIHPPSTGNVYAEMGLLRLNWDKASHRLKWRPAYTWEQAVATTVSWFKKYDEHCKHPQAVDMYDVGVDHIRSYVKQAQGLGLNWANESLSLVEV